MTDPNEDTEWNDILRAHKILPPKGPSDRDIFYAAADAEVDRRRAEDPLEGKDLDELDELEDDFDDEVMQQYRLQRLSEMQAEAAGRRYGSLEHISKPEWVREVTEASEDVHVVVHMYKDGFVQCRKVNAQLTELAQEYPKVKFLKITAEQCVPGYPDANLPTILVYSKGDVLAQLIGPHAFIGGITAIETLLVQTGAVRPDEVPRRAKDGRKMMRGEESADEGDQEEVDSDYDL